MDNVGGDVVKCHPLPGIQVEAPYVGKSAFIRIPRPKTSVYGEVVGVLEGQCPGGADDFLIGEGVDHALGGEVPSGGYTERPLGDRARKVACACDTFTTAHPLGEIVGVFHSPVAAVGEDGGGIGAVLRHLQILVLCQFIALITDRYDSPCDNAFAVFIGQFPCGQLGRQMDIEGAHAAHILAVVVATVFLHRQLIEHQVLRLGDPLGVLFILQAPVSHTVAPRGGGETVSLSYL